MAADTNNHEIIDLTIEPEVITLDSDGEEVGESSQQANGAVSSPTSSNGAVQTRKKRKKRKRKSTGNSATAQNSPYEDGEISSAEVSRPETPVAPPAGKDLPVEDVCGPSIVKKTLVERLTEPSRAKREEEDSRRQRTARMKERRRKWEMEEEKLRQRDRERDRRRSRSPRHDRKRERDRTRRRSPSKEHERNRRKRDKVPEVDVPLFFEDVTPAELPAMVRPPLPECIAGTSNPNVTAVAQELPTEVRDADALLLPTHVSVAEGGKDADTSPLKVPAPEGSDDDEDYIEYLDYDDDRRAPGMVRYWELEKIEAEEARASKPTRFVCKKCGAEDEHKTFECPVMICLTCGVRDEHPTRSCPISKVCFTCGMKGHINKTCPNRGKADKYHSSHDCDRCGARTHQTNECSTLWRMYKYVEDDVRQEILRVREGKQSLALGQGGEGYIATDEWCYNCGECGHLGDDCTEQHPFDFPSEHSAFSLYNILSGPFSSEASRPSKRAPRDWETASAFGDGFGSTIPLQVGKEGKRKERERLARRAHEQEDAEDDAADWFGSRSRASGGAGNKDKDTKASSAGAGRSKGGGKIKFEFSGKSLSRDRDGKRQRAAYEDLPGPSKETDSMHIRGAARKQSYGSTGSRDRHGRYERDRERDRYRESERGPRYRGGYSR